MKSILFQYGPIQVPAYGFMIMLGFMSAMWIAYYRAKLTKVRPEIVIDIGIYGMITGIIGARLWYIVQYHYFFNWEMMNIQDGGFSILGGFAGVLIFLASYRNLDYFFYCGLTLLIRGLLEHHEYLSRVQGKHHLTDLIVLVILAGIAYANREHYRNFFSTKRKAFFLLFLMSCCMLFTSRLIYMGIHYSHYFSDHWILVQTQDQKPIQIGVTTEEGWKSFCEQFSLPFAQDELFRSQKLRLKNLRALSDRVSPYFIRETSETWLKKLAESHTPAKYFKDDKGNIIPGDAFGLFKIWKGGMVSFGGLFFATFVVCFVIAKYNLPLARVTDLCIPGVAFAIGITRAGCFMNGCCFGGVPNGNYYLGVIYPKGSLCWDHHLRDLKIISPDWPAHVVHAAQFYESVACFLLFLALTWWYPRRRKEGEMIFLLGFGYGVLRFLVEQVRDDTPIVMMGRNIGEITGIVLILFSVFSFYNLRYHWIPVMKYLRFLDPLQGSEVDYQPEK
ncbi:MAG: prolipoprotein diacylglyceryl transferase family protein [Planctomycetota bacterium]